MSSNSFFKEIFGADLGDFMTKPVPEIKSIAKHRVVSQDGVITVTGKYKKVVVNGVVVSEWPKESK
jgi:hypothetical protein